MNDRGLDRSIGRLPSGGVHRRDGRNVQHAALRGFQCGQCRLRRMDDRHHVDRETAGPAFRVIRRTEGRGVVDQEIDTTKRFGGGADVAADRIFVGQIGGGGMGFVAVLSDLGAGLFECGRVAGADGNVASGGGETEGDGAADASAATADDGFLAGEVDVHVVASRLINASVATGDARRKWRVGRERGWSRSRQIGSFGEPGRYRHWTVIAEPSPTLARASTIATAGSVDPASEFAGSYRDSYCFEYGYSMSPVFNSGGQRITSVFGSRNCSMSLDFTFWNCTANTLGSSHSPLGPNFTSPTMVLNVPLRSASASLSSSTLFAASIACCNTCT